MSSMAASPSGSSAASTFCDATTSRCLGLEAEDAAGTWAAPRRCSCTATATWSMRLIFIALLPQPSRRRTSSVRVISTTFSATLPARLAELGREEIRAPGRAAAVAGTFLSADDAERDAARARAARLLGERRGGGVERVAGEDAARVRAVVEAEVPERVAGRVAAREREDPREDEPAVDDARLGERARLAVALVDVERVGVARQRGELHVLGLADRAADGVGEDVADVEVLPEARGSRRGAGRGEDAASGPRSRRGGAAGRAAGLRLAGSGRAAGPAGGSRRGRRGPAPCARRSRRARRRR